MHNHSPSDTLNPSAAVRAKLCEALRLDLIGPHNDHAFARELLPERPERDESDPVHGGAAAVTPGEATG